MNPDLADLLERAVPEPVRHLDAEQVLRAARHRRRVRAGWAAGGAAAGVAVVVAAVVVAAVASTTGSWLADGEAGPAGPDEVPLVVSALDDRQPLNANLLGALDTTDLAHPGEGALVARVGRDGTTVDQADVWLVEATGDQLCLVIEDGYGGVGYGCSARSDLLDLGVLTVVSEHEPPLLVVVAPDGYTTATLDGEAAPVTDNVAVLPVSAERDVVLSGPDVPGVTLDPALVLGSGWGGSDVRELDQEARARAALEDLVRSARRYAEANGDTDGFAGQLVADSGPAAAQNFRTLTDATAVADIGGGQCLTADLVAGEVTGGPCA